ncbi:MAG: FAD:protein FMN transferase [Bacteroidales bacterium]|nr:FAD:protein FMN transferase [Bacteroidales bacterium]
MKKGFISALIIIFVTSFFFTGCAPENEHRVNLQGSAQGTYYNITYYDKQNRNFHPEVDSILHAFDKSVSLWVSTSIISRVNNDDSTVVLDSNFVGNFNYSQEVSKATNGAFDMTVGPLVEVWGFGFENRENVTQHIVDSLKQFVGYQKMKIVDGKVMKADPRMQIDFNGIAQGYSDDVVARYLESKGIHNYLIDIGGEVVGHGKKPDGPWLVGIEKPAPDADAPRTVKAIIKLENQSVATSGSYRKYYVKNGIKYSHTIDPATGYPVQHSLLSVSVLMKNTALADAYATAFMVMGYPKAREFVESHPEMEAFFIWSGKDGKFHNYATEGFKKVIVSEDK